MIDTRDLTYGSGRRTHLLAVAKLDVPLDNATVIHHGGRLAPLPRRSSVTALSLPRPIAPYDRASAARHHSLHGPRGRPDKPSLNARDASRPSSSFSPPRRNGLREFSSGARRAVYATESRGGIHTAPVRVQPRAPAILTISAPVPRAPARPASPATASLAPRVSRYVLRGRRCRPLVAGARGDARQF